MNSENEVQECWCLTKSGDNKMFYVGVSNLKCVGFIVSKIHVLSLTFFYQLWAIECVFTNCWPDKIIMKSCGSNLYDLYSFTMHAWAIIR